MEFTDEELELFMEWFNNFPYDSIVDEELAQRILDEIERRKELASIDFNECEGGACKL